PSSSTQTINSAVNYQEFKKFRNAIQYCLCISITGFLFGYDIGTIGGLVNLPSFKQKFGDDRTIESLPSFKRNTLGIIIGSFSISAAFGGLFLSSFADKIGRRFVLIIAMILYILGDFVISLSSQWYFVLIGRFLNGSGIGCSSSVSPMFISELAPAKLRGTLVSALQFLTTLGILTGSFVIFFCKNLQGTNQFLVPLYIGFGAGIFSIGLLLTVLESPVYLVKSNNLEDARCAIAYLNHITLDHWYVEHCMTEIKSRFREKIEDLQNTYQQQKGHSIKAKGYSYHEDNLLPYAICGIILMSLQQFTGINYFFFYGTSIFGSAGIDDPYLTSIILAAVNFIFSTIALLLVDKFKRRFLLFLGSAIMFSCMISFSSIGTFALSKSSGEQNSFPGIVMIIFTCIFIAAFTLSWGPLSYVVVSEVFPSKFQSKGTSISTTANWVSNFLVSFCTPFITEKIGFSYGYAFAFSLCLSMLFVWFYIPETK
ncbi:hypothetical protein PACTADRAFT_22495, partial [Pachysolen tannophilus NRRL Y-2460]